MQVGDEKSGVNDIPPPYSLLRISPQRVCPDTPALTNTRRKIAIVGPEGYDVQNKAPAQATRLSSEYISSDIPGRGFYVRMKQNLINTVRMYYDDRFEGDFGRLSICGRIRSWLSSHPFTLS